MIKNIKIWLYDLSIYIDLVEDAMQFDLKTCWDKSKSLMTKEHMKTSSLVFVWPWKPVLSNYFAIYTPFNI